MIENRYRIEQGAFGYYVADGADNRSVCLCTRESDAMYIQRLLEKDSGMRAKKLNGLI